MPSDLTSKRVVMLAYGVLLLLAPVVVLSVTLGFLVLSGDLLLGRLSPLEFLELYLIELLVFLTFGYGLYRLTVWTAEPKVPTLLDELESSADAEPRTDDETEPGERGP